MNVADELRDLISEAAESLGASAAESLDDAVDYAARRASHLAAAVGEPGYMAALEAEARNVAIMAAVGASDAASAADERFVRIVQGGLRVIAGVLSKA